MSRYLIVLIAAVGLLLGACGSDNAEPATTVADTAATVEAYVEAFNAHDIDAVMALFSEESIVSSNDELGPSFADGVRGLALIEAVVGSSLAVAAAENAIVISNVELSGNTVTWDQVQTIDLGNRYCTYGESAVIEDGKILTWTSPDDGRHC